MTKKTVAQLEMEKYIDEAVADCAKELRDEIKKGYAIKLVEGIVFGLCGIILATALYTLLSNIGLSK